MVTEDYVSYEIAKLLKEKGFNWNTDKQFNSDKIVGDYNITDRSRHPERYLDAPTIQMAMKWLREVHNIAIAVIPLSFTLKGSENFICNNWVFNLWENGNPTVSEFYGNQTAYSTYEEAAEAAIKYCLENLI